MNDKKPMTIIGRTSTADFPAENIRDVPVKIDTGADSSSIWASELHMGRDGVLHFVLFANGSPYFSGKVHSAKNYTVHLVRSSNGSAQIRYKVELAVVLGGRTIRGRFTLADRSKNTFPVLVGSSTLRNKFLVDVSKRSKIRPEGPDNSGYKFTEELKKDPHAFFKKYHIDNNRGDIEL
jgi:hypothetical protein